MRPDARRRHLADLRAAVGAEQPGEVEGDPCVPREIAEIYAAHFAIHGGGCSRDGPKLPAFHLTFVETGETCCDTAEHLRAWTLRRLEDLRAGLISKRRPASPVEDAARPSNKCGSAAWESEDFALESKCASSVEAGAEGSALPGGGTMRLLMRDEIEEPSSSEGD